jgi:hypothetical protein
VMPMPGAIHPLREVFILSETTNRQNFGVLRRAVFTTFGYCTIIIINCY